MRYSFASIMAVVAIYSLPREAEVSNSEIVLEKSRARAACIAMGLVPAPCPTSVHIRVMRTHCGDEFVQQSPTRNCTAYLFRCDEGRFSGFAELPVGEDRAN